MGHVPNLFQFSDVFDTLINLFEYLATVKEPFAQQQLSADRNFFFLWVFQKETFQIDVIS